MPIFGAMAEAMIDPGQQPAGDGPILILQPLPGVGDLVWHLSAIHAIAAAHPNHERILLTKHRTRADEMYIADPSISRVIWVDRAEQHSGPGVVALLRCDRRLYLAQPEARELERADSHTVLLRVVREIDVRAMSLGDELQRLEQNSAPKFSL